MYISRQSGCLSENTRVSLFLKYSSLLWLYGFNISKYKTKQKKYMYQTTFNKMKLI